MRLCTIIIFSLLLLNSCKQKIELVTKTEALQLAKEIDSSINNKKPQHFNSLINAAAFASKVADQAGLKTSSAAIQGVREGLNKIDLADKIIRSIQNKGIYQLVKHYEKEKVHHLVFRLFSDEGLNYHDFELIKKEGEIYIGDIFIYLSGENLSKTIAALMVDFNSGPDKLSYKGYNEIQSLKKMRDLVNNNENQKALNIYNNQSAEFKEQKTVQLIHLLICSQLDDSSYAEAIDHYKTSFPNEANLYLVLIDRYILKKEYDKSIECINTVDSLLGKDPFLDYYRGLIYNIMNKPADARKYLEQLHHNMPGFGSGVLELIASYIKAQMDTEARQLIAEYEKNEKFDQQSLENYLYTQPQFQKEIISQ